MDEKKSNLLNTSGEIVRDNFIKAGIKAAKEGNYATGNKTDLLLELAQKAGVVVDGGTALIGGGESASAFGRIDFKL